MVSAFILILKIFGSSTLGVVLFFPIQFRKKCYLQHWDKVH